MKLTHGRAEVSPGRAVVGFGTGRTIVAVAAAATAAVVDVAIVIVFRGGVVVAIVLPV
jgi:DNA-binding transcriptional regulator LsrR (DeoR family)